MTALDDAALRAQLYERFEGAGYLDDEGERKPFGPNRYKVADLLDALRAVAHVAVDTPTPSWLGGNQPTAADELISCSNGLVQFPTRTLYPHTPFYYAHHAVPFAFDPNAPTPNLWLKFLGELWPKDAESVNTLQELFGSNERLGTNVACFGALSGCE